MFETEVPEIYDGIVEIKSISREAGSRTKIAVCSKDDQVDAVGACIGTRGARVNTIVNELNGEKIDIVVYDDDPKRFIAAALSPASVVNVQLAADGSKSCRVTVPDGQLSLAIGNKGQNARLAAKLTGWKIDIRPESGFFGEEEDDFVPADDAAKLPSDNAENFEGGIEEADTDSLQQTVEDTPEGLVENEEIAEDLDREKDEKVQNAVDAILNLESEE